MDPLCAGPCWGRCGSGVAGAQSSSQGLSGAVGLSDVEDFKEKQRQKDRR